MISVDGSPGGARAHPGLPLGRVREGVERLVRHRDRRGAALGVDVNMTVWEENEADVPRVRADWAASSTGSSSSALHRRAARPGRAGSCGADRWWCRAAAPWCPAAATARGSWSRRRRGPRRSRRSGISYHTRLRLLLHTHDLLRALVRLAVRPACPSRRGRQGTTAPPLCTPSASPRHRRPARPGATPPAARRVLKRGI